jgi:hypothetical protein
MKQVCGTRYDHPKTGHAMCQRDAGHEVHGERIPDESLKHLASAMKQVLPPELLQQVMDHMDPLTPFLEYLRSA